MRVAYVMDPTGRLNAATDSTVELIRAHHRRGDEVIAVMRRGVSCGSFGLRLRGRQVIPSENDRKWCRLGERKEVHASELDGIALRLEPPVDAGFRNVCAMLEIAKAYDVRVANDPRSVAFLDEKVHSLFRPDLAPETMVGSNPEALAEFAAALESGAVVKPVGQMGGKGVFSFGPGDTNVRVAIALLLEGGGHVVVQERLAGIEDGDRRVFVIGGSPHRTMLNRVPAEGSHLGNMVAGGRPEAMDLGEDERRIAEAIGKDLLVAGIYFAGIDVIGGKLTEINITCPTGLRTVRDQTGESLADAVIKESFVRGRPRYRGKTPKSKRQAGGQG